MNDQAPRTPIVLPDLSADTIARMESGVFQRISADRTVTAARQKRRRNRTVLWSAAAATVVVAGAAVVPSLVGTASGSGDSYSAADMPTEGGAAESMEAPSAIAGDASVAAPDSAGAKTDTSAIEPQVITTASMSITVTDVEQASAGVTQITTALSGYVSSQNLGSNEYRYEVDPSQMSSSTVPTYGWITVRIPEGSVDDAITQLEALGTVTGVTIDRYDVTQQSVDLQARVSSLEASVARLEELMTQSGSVADLIVAESALSERQAELESLQQQLDSLTDQVAMSTISVDLRAESTPVDADPDGFGDGLLAGWNGLIAALNGVILALGFALPWLAVIAVIVLVVWVIRRARRSRRNTTAVATHPHGEADL